MNNVIIKNAINLKFIYDIFNLYIIYLIYVSHILLDEQRYYKERYNLEIYI